MAIRTKIIVQQILNIDDTTTTASKYPKYTVVLGNSISSITAGELTAAVESSAASAAAAKDSEIAAKSSETNARDSENRAAIYADSSEASATQSATSATESERQAELSKASAEESAASATEAGTHKDAAQLAAQNAERSRELAEQAKTAAQQAQVAAETAKTGAETAKEGADAAATTAGEHAAAAKQSELNAKVSETNAAGSATEAGDKAIDATAEADRAKAEADRASQVVDGKLDKVDISGFIKVYKTKAEADADVANRVLDEKILVWNQTESKYGWYKVAGTTKAPVLELVETEQKLVSINNVHADDAGNVQITLPGGNPSLWLGEVTWFPYDKDSGVGYPGVLPADGREVLRVDYPDTWEAIEAGLIPSVSEADWQAGASLYFSTGDGSTTFRLPDMMQGQAFRAPTKGEEDAGVVKDQIPYVVTVNGISPDDTTGNVEIDTSLQGTVDINQGGTGATTKEDARIALELYSIAEVDSALADKANIATTYTKTEVDSALADKANIATTYTKTEVDSALADAKTQSDTDYLLKANNLSDLEDRGEAWLNVRPIGSTPLAADPVSDYDAATKRWVQNLIGAGTVGPTMNGVMNYGVGKPSFNSSRAYIAPYELPMDGQLVERANWPELWAYAQMHGAIEDSAWLANPLTRGKYSKGDGTTTFRLPDWNGKRRNGDMIDGTPFTGADSIHALFARGDGVDVGDNAGVAPGTIRPSAAPNAISNIVGVMLWNKGATSAQGGLSISNVSANVPATPGQPDTGPMGGGTLTLDLSKINAAYGRDASPEVRPNSVTAVWVVRASGGFVAANTSWSVINADLTAPANGTIVKGGAVRSVYKVGAAEYGGAELKASIATDGAGVKTVDAEVVVVDSTSGTAVSKTIKLGTVDGVTGGSVNGRLRVTNSPQSAPFTSDGTNTWQETPGVFRNIIAQGEHSSTQWGLIDYLTNNNTGKAFVRLIPFASPTDFSIFQIDHTGEATARVFTPTCDERTKKDIERVKDPLAAMQKIRGVTFRYKDSGIFGIGFTAQDVEAVFPEAVSSGEDLTLKDGTKVLGVKRPDTYGVAAALHHEAILKLMEKIEALEAKIAELEAE